MDVYVFIKRLKNIYKVINLNRYVVKNKLIGESKVGESNTKKLY